MLVSAALIAAVLAIGEAGSAFSAVKETPAGDVGGGGGGGPLIRPAAMSVAAALVAGTTKL